MNRQRKGWYLFAYDIADPRRLQKVHRLIRKKGISAQKSLFFVRGTESRINMIMDELVALMKLNEDDLRAYPIADPRKVWTFGQNPLATFPTVCFDTRRPAPRKATPKNMWRRLLRL